MAVGKLDVWLNQKENQEDIVFKDRVSFVFYTYYYSYNSYYYNSYYYYSD